METNNGSNKYLTKQYIYNENHVNSYKTVAVILT